MKSKTFTIEIPKPKGWQPNIKKPKKLGLFGIRCNGFWGWYVFALILLGVAILLIYYA